MGPDEPPQRKGQLPQYARNKLVELQDKFDQVEELGVFKRPEDIGISIEYLNPSFLVKKQSGGYRLDSMKYCGVATPFKGGVYVPSAMGMPGSQTALEELRNLLQEGIVVKIADDLYCGGNTPYELLENWKNVLQALYQCDLHLSASKTVVNPTSTTILGLIWRSETLQASPHRITTLASCPAPETVACMRSFIGAYKVLARVLPNCSRFMAPLDDIVARRQSNETISWSDDLSTAFKEAQLA
ncbi:uncharacterized protein [Montipora capricornis]|uniref:uncharacterized protein n=1 Tax=Montipora capricornis TaxID=246305 RepID=UPI0035F1737C